MQAFRTPLFKFLVLYILILLGLKQIGFFKPPQIKTPPVLWQSGYHLVKAKIGAPLARGWKVRVFAIDGGPHDLNLYLSFREPAAALHPQLIPGASVLVWAQFLVPEKPPFAGVFDWNEYLARRGVAAQALAETEKDWRLLKPAAGPLAYLLRWRENLLIKIRQDFSPSGAGFLSGLILGEKRLLGSALKEEFREAGLIHLLVVSGLHVTMLAASIAFFLGRVLRLGPRVAAGGGLLGAWVFTLIAGLQPPVLRAACMLTALFAGPLLQRETPALTRLFAVAFIFLLFRPSLLWDASFLLSFAATFGILYGWALPCLSQADAQSPESPSVLRRFLKSGLRLAGTSLFAWYALLPFQAGLFHQFSLVAPLANMILVPWSGLYLIWGVLHAFILAFLPGIGVLSRQFLSLAMEIFLAAVRWFSHWPYGEIATSPWNLFLIGAWLCGFAAMAQRKAWALAFGLGASVLGIGLHTAVRASSPLTLVLLGSQGHGQMLYGKQGFHSFLCHGPEAQGELGRTFKEFLQAQAAGGAPNLCVGSEQRFLVKNIRVLESDFPFFRDSDFLYLGCGAHALIFPLTPFAAGRLGRNAELPIINRKEGIFAQKHVCHGAGFL